MSSPIRCCVIADSKAANGGGHSSVPTGNEDADGQVVEVVSAALLERRIGLPPKKWTPNCLSSFRQEDVHDALEAGE